MVQEKDNVHQTNLQNDSQSCNNDEVGDGDIFPSDENEALESLEDSDVIDRCSVYSTDLSESKSVSSMQDEIALHEDQGHQSEEVVDQGQSEEVIRYLPTMKPLYVFDWSIEDKAIYEEQGILTCLCDRYKKYIESKIGAGPITVQEGAQIDLLHRLMQTNSTPLHLFDDMLKWAYKWSCQSAFNDLLMQRKNVILGFQRRLDLLPKFGETVLQVQLPSSPGSLLPVTVHSFLDGLYSLLTDPEVMHDDHLLFHNNDPFSFPPDEFDDPEYLYSDVYDGSLFQEGYYEYIKDPSLDVLCGVILFIDKTHIDSKGRFTLEPVSFTLGIFTKEFRSKSKAWHTLGYIPNQALTTKHLSSLEKAIDYHCVLGHILNSLRTVQNSAGVAWNLFYHGNTHRVVFQFPIMFVIGDTETNFVASI